MTGTRARLVSTVPGTKGCPKCMEIKPIEKFSVAKQYRSGRASWCKDCQRIHLVSSRRTTRLRVYASQRAWLNREKSAPCADCGGSFPPECMDFDHVRGEKSFGISASVGGFALARVQEELAKCDLVCANCHRVRTRKKHHPPPQGMR